jgi:hypothetical protein
LPRNQRHWRHFLGADGAFRSTDNPQSWVEINHDVIETDVRVLAINPAVTFLQKLILAAVSFDRQTMATAGRLLTQA